MIDSRLVGPGRPPRPACPRVPAGGWVFPVVATGGSPGRSCPTAARSFGVRTVASGTPRQRSAEARFGSPQSAGPERFDPGVRVGSGLAGLRDAQAVADGRVGWASVWSVPASAGTGFGVARRGEGKRPARGIGAGVRGVSRRRAK